LEVYCLRLQFGHQLGFQFHFGSIGRDYVELFEIINQSFNSTLVRLEVHPDLSKLFKYQVSIPLWFDWKLNMLAAFLYCSMCFNSTLVRLEERLPIHVVLIQQSFNSTLVRLEEAVNEFINTLNRFQFHFGSIGRFIGGEQLDELCHVSIPLWFDWKLATASPALKRQEQQRIVGSIGSWPQPASRLPTTPVSIPLWFDWKTVKIIAFDGVSMFQFHFGSIGRFKHVPKGFPEFACFNSTLVRLEATCFDQCHPYQSRFNSTLVRLEVLIF